jgi:hypothetical protein
VEDSTYVGLHELISRTINLSDIHEHGGDNRNIVIPNNHGTIMDEISRMFGVSKVRGL